MKFFKIIVLFAFIGLIAVSCKETKKEELKETIDIIEEESEPTDTTESNEVQKNEKSAAEKPANSTKPSESEPQTDPPVEVVEVSTEDLSALEAEDEDEILEMAADVPVVYPGCGGGTASEIRACSLNKFITFFSENFNSEVVDELDDLKAGIHSMRALLKIDKTGNISVKRVLAEKKELEEEFRRVVALYPVMTPAIKNGEAVDVKFVLPIKFNVLN